MKIKEIKVKSIINKSGLECDFVINPYIGCMHGCKYCYAKFMKRFTNHPEEWGSFVDVKVNAPDLIVNNKKYKNKEFLIGSVCDPYMPIEAKYKITRRILEKLTDFDIKLTILTKSSLVTRDIDLFKKFKNITVVISFLSLNEDYRKQLEFASSSNDRINALKELNKNKIKTVVFISPIFPKVTDYKEIIIKTKDFCNEYWFENLNLYPSIKSNINGFYKRNKLEYNVNWDELEKEIKEYCNKERIKYRIYFHHSKKV